MAMKILLLIVTLAAFPALAEDSPSAVDEKAERMIQLHNQQINRHYGHIKPQQFIDATEERLDKQEEIKDEVNRIEQLRNDDIILRELQQLQ